MDNQFQPQNTSISTNLPSKLKTKIPLLIIILIVFIAGVAGFTYAGLRKEKVGQLAPSKNGKLVVAKPVIPLKKYDTKLQNGPFSCPTIDSVCKNGTYKNNSLIANVPNGSAIYAAFDGTVDGLLSYHPNPDKTQEEFYFLVLTNKERGLEAFYSIKAEKDKVIVKKQVKAGEKMATSNGQAIKFKDNKSFIFEMVKMGETGATRSALSKNSFK